MYIRRWRDEGVTLVTRVGGDCRASGIVIFSHFIVFKLYNNCTTCLKIVCQKERMRLWYDGADNELSQGWANCARTGLFVNRDKTERNVAPKNITKDLVTI